MKFDHLLVMTDDLPEAIDFFTQIMGLEPGPRPPFSFPGAWLYSGDQAVIHLAQTNVSTGQDYVGGNAKGGLTYVDHIAYTASGATAFIAKVEAAGLQYFERRVPGTGERQIFVIAPNGLKFEFVFREPADL